MFHYTVETDKSIEGAVQSVEQSLKNHKFGVLWQMDIPAKLQEKGVDFNQPFRVLEVCNPVEAKRVLSQNSLVGYFLPCKVVVYEENGRTKIGLPRPTALMEVVNDPELREIAQNIENTLIDALNEAV
ncbi:DUF302 domain-containing protein [Alicyclobacillus curvatus]|uniref:DUF302 domain-containing protein n=1 Tax=Alicyclobacillus mengziensis TaxID=2931921 RepID=A0A9X7Z8V6_9BACL|nr:DUF302 domain-containing protein [Alicyclobacillus mengziensis]QSO48661.1 DUF302 domain-containing protein [Alicyclobacillus mengziensis]QSO52922.1 DUF302 domain-containing protein [Alicyclobacillus curvatus]